MALALVVCLAGVQSGCVTAWAMQEIFSVEGEGPDPSHSDSRPPSSGWLWGRIGLAVLVLPLALAGDLSFGLLLGALGICYEIDLDDSDEAEEPDEHDLALESQGG